MLGDDTTMAKLSERLRRSPAPSSVPGSLPVLFFGNLMTAHVATVALNPSDQEFVGFKGKGPARKTYERSGTARRFETLCSLGASDRAVLTPAQCNQALVRMRDYFLPGKPVYWWFYRLMYLMKGMGVGYEAGSAVHLDLVQEATVWKFGLLDATEATALMDADRDFLLWQLARFPLNTLVCNGQSAFDGVSALVACHFVAGGTWPLSMCS